MATAKTIKVPAIRFTQNGNTLYSFPLDIKKVSDIADDAIMQRDENGGLLGFQRGQIAAHVKTIAEYLESPNAKLPNALTLGFMKGREGFRELRFQPVDKENGFGILNIPCGPSKIGVKVDGQQRSAAGEAANIGDFPVTVVAFEAETDAEFAEHFMRVNNSKPLPKNVLTELVPHVDVDINKGLAKLRKPAIIRDRLNLDGDSPLKGLIQTKTNVGGKISDTTFLKVLEESFKIGRGLDQIEEQDGDPVEVLKAFWGAVRETFYEAWTLPKKDSRLFTKAGVRGLAGLFEVVVDQVDKDKLDEPFFRKALKLVASSCHWTEGEWNFGKEGRIPWNQLQGTEVHSNILAAHLGQIYKKARGTA